MVAMVAAAGQRPDESLAVAAGETLILRAGARWRVAAIAGVAPPCVASAAPALRAMLCHAPLPPGSLKRASFRAIRYGIADRGAASSRGVRISFTQRLERTELAGPHADG